MDGTDPKPRRPRAWDDTAYAWNLARVPPCLQTPEGPVPHPARDCAVFVVHGIGDQAWTATAAQLRSGFEDALEDIGAWQARHPAGEWAPAAEDLPPPFVFDGYWADYDDLAATFPGDWARFTPRERRFFQGLWRRRTGWLPTYLWFLGQQLRLLHPRNLRQAPWNYLLYLALQPVALAALTLAALRRPRVLTRVLGDVRLYLAPRGTIEKAVAQGIDRRVGAAFLRLLGLDWDFLPLPTAQRIQASGRPVTFRRVVWVAHSLGTVISYNVLSDLFQRAAHLEAHGNALQRRGVATFRSALRRFVTLGSPLDKAAFLFGEQALRPWPAAPRPALLEGGEDYALGEDGGTRRCSEWWINFHSPFDPVSGALEHPLVCGGRPPLNLMSDTRASDLLPGMAHVNYWRDRRRTLRFILGRTYGRAFLRDRLFRPYPPLSRVFTCLLAYVYWAAVLGALLWGLWTWLPRLPALLL